MTVVERDIFIAASTKEIMDYSVYRPDNLPDWFVGVESVEPDDVYPDAGGTMLVTYKAAGVTMETKMTVLEFTPGEKFEQQMEGIASASKPGHTIQRKTVRSLPPILITRCKAAASVKLLTSSLWSGRTPNSWKKAWKTSSRRWNRAANRESN